MSYAIDPGIDPARPDAQMAQVVQFEVSVGDLRLHVQDDVAIPVRRGSVTMMLLGAPSIATRSKDATRA